MFKKLLLFVVLPCCYCAKAQYTLNGSATQDACNLYTLTAATNNQSGSVWNNNKINLTQSFDFKFDVFLGNNDAGADGIVFVLQPISTSVGTTGGGLGYQGITPAVGVTIDTWQNTPNNDPVFDHIAIQLNGDIGHNTANNIAGPVQVIAGTDNIEDGQWHALRIVWDVTTKTFSAYIDGALRVTAVKDFVADIFAGNPLVYWGFTGSTGGANNLQHFKTALNPAFNFSATQKRCLNEPITFIDSTISFSTIAKFYWDFGDGSPIDSVNLNPVHTYTVGGDYIIKQRVIGADGCEATNTQTVRVGTKPVAAFGYGSNCILTPVSFSDSSIVNVGTINQWYWDFGDNTSSAQKNLAKTFASFGNKNISLVVKSVEGCISDTLKKTIYVYTPPIVDFTFNDSVCANQQVNFLSAILNLPGDTAAVIWNWNINNTVLYPSVSNPAHIFSTPGNKGVILLAAPAYSDIACAATKTKNVFIVDKPTADFINGTICQAAVVTFTDASSNSDNVPINQWWWNINGNITGTQKTIITTYSNAGVDTVKLVVRNSKGCVSDTLKKAVVVNPKPVAKFGIGNPLCSGFAISFSDSSATTGQVINSWSWIYNNTQWSTSSSTTKAFSSGNPTVGLTVANTLGCKSDTIYKTFYVNSLPDVSINFKDACKFAPVNFSATDNSGTVTQWKWEFGDGVTANAQNTQHSYNANGVYKVKLYATAATGCYSDSLQKNITIYGTNAFAGNDTIAAAGQPVQLRASGGLSYAWSPANLLNDASVANPVAVLNNTQTFTVKAFTPEGCESYDDVTIKIYKGPEIYLPNAFTPNGDGLNDILTAIPVGLKQFDYLKIYNRWGQLIFYSTNYRNGWNGEWKNQKQPEGTYVALVKGTDYKGNTIENKVLLMLIR